MQKDYHDLEELAAAKEEENWKFRKFLKFYDALSDDELDKIVFRLASQWESEIDCTNCGRCCKKLKPTLSADDQQRLAELLGITVEQLKDQYLTYDHEESDWQIKASPCPFLHNNRCSIYECRPDDCRGYPYLQESGFSYRTMGMIERTFTCPIVFNVMEGLKKEIVFEADDLDAGY
jgi:Fe-S-cluster containining protein